MSIKDWPVSERPREKLLANGAHSLSDAELLAVLLGGSGRRGLDAVALARALLSSHQSLRALLSAQHPPGAAPTRRPWHRRLLPAAGGGRARAPALRSRPCAPARRSIRRRRRAIS